MQIWSVHPPSANAVRTAVRPLSQTGPMEQNSESVLLSTREALQSNSAPHYWWTQSVTIHELGRTNNRDQSMSDQTVDRSAANHVDRPSGTLTQANKTHAQDLVTVPSGATRCTKPGSPTKIELSLGATILRMTRAARATGAKVRPCRRNNS